MKHLYTLLLLAILPFSAFAQFGSMGMSDAVSTGFGKTYTMNSRGVYAIGINPANLALPQGRKYEVAPPLNLGMRLGTDFLTVDEFNYFFGGVDSAGTKIGRRLTVDDKNRMVDLFKNGGTLMMDVSMMQFGATARLDSTIGAFGFSIQDVFFTKFKFPSGIIRLAMYGNTIGEEYDLNDMQFQSIFYRAYNFAYARQFKILPKWFQTTSVGIGIKYVAGYAYAGLDDIHTSILTTEDSYIVNNVRYRALSAFSDDFGVNYDFDSLSADKTTSFSSFPSTAGSGVGFDIGFSGIINDKWSVAIALTDIGSIKWKKNAAEYTSESSFTIKDVSDKNLADSLKDEVTANGRYISSFTTSLPTALRLGATYIFKPNVFALSADWNFGLNNAPRNSKIGRFSVGGEWNATKWLPYLRGGFSFGGQDFFSWTVGIGVNVWKMEFNAATPDFQYVFKPNSGKRISFAAGWRFRFD